jgi:hypothetical protein
MFAASRRPLIGALGQASRAPRDGEVKAASSGFFYAPEYQFLTQRKNYGRFN